MICHSEHAEEYNYTLQFLQGDGNLKSRSSSISSKERIDDGDSEFDDEVKSGQ
jgi:hypothetical protein